MEQTTAYSPEKAKAIYDQILIDYHRACQEIEITDDLVEAMGLHHGHYIEDLKKFCNLLVESPSLINARNLCYASRFAWGKIYVEWARSYTEDERIKSLCETLNQALTTGLEVVLAFQNSLEENSAVAGICVPYCENIQWRKTMSDEMCKWETPKEIRLSSVNKLQEMPVER